MAVVLRKTKNDDRLITALRADLAAAVQGNGVGRHIRESVTGVDRWAPNQGAGALSRLVRGACARSALVGIRGARVPARPGPGLKTPEA